MINKEQIFLETAKIIIHHYTSNGFGVWLIDDEYVLYITTEFKIIINPSRFNYGNNYYNIVAILKYNDMTNEIILPLNPIMVINMLDYYIKGFCKGMNLHIDEHWENYLANT